MPTDEKNPPAPAETAPYSPIDLREQIDGVIMPDEQAQLAARELLGLLDPSLSVIQQLRDEEEIMAMAESLHNSAVWALVTEALIAQAKARHPAFSQLDEATQLRLAEEETARQEAVDLMERRRYAETAPRFADQLRDESRTKTFRFNQLPPHIDPEGWESMEATETDGLHDLDMFLSLFLAVSQREEDTYVYPNEAEQAKSLLENLTFIGQKEYDKGADGLATLWKRYLDEDPDRKICIVTGATNSRKYPGKQKSDAHLKASILSKFTDVEREKYASRLLEKIEDIQDESPKNVRIVLLDDWTVSGQQLNRIYNEMMEDSDMAHFADFLEINLLAASGERIRNGLSDPDDPARKPIRVRAYFMAHEAPLAQKASKSHISGLHSTVNYDFGDTIERIVKRFGALGIPQEIPHLASIVRPYRDGSVKSDS